MSNNQSIPQAPIKRRIIIDLTPHTEVTLEFTAPDGQIVHYPEMDWDVLKTDPQFVHLASKIVDLAQALYARGIERGAQRIAVPLDLEPPDTPPTASQE